MAKFKRILELRDELIEADRIIQKLRKELNLPEKPINDVSEMIREIDLHIGEVNASDRKEN